MTTNHCIPCARRGRPCAWHTTEGIAFSENAWTDHDHDATGHDVEPDFNGLQLHTARVADAIRARRVVRLEGTEAA